MEDHTTTTESQTLDQALLMGSMGYKIIPVPKGQKFPKGLAGWQKRATSDESQILDWWGRGEAGIGWAMGRQPNGEFLVAIDVDVNDGKVGKATIEALIKKHDLASTFQLTTTQRTGTGGYHFVFVCMGGFEPTNGVLGEHVDVRGEGGFVVIAPSIHPNGNPYRWTKPPWEQLPSPFPKPLVDLLTPVEIEPPAEVQSLLPVASLNSTPASGGDGESPADWVRANKSIGSMLVEAGWTYMENKGDDSYWCRPGKNPRDGHSAILHGEGPLVVWSTTAPMEFWRPGRENADGSRSLSPLDVYAAVHHKGDIRRASSSIRTEMMPKPLVLGGGSGEPGASDEGVGEGTSGVAGDLNLPDEFWQARPLFEQIRAGAWNRSVSPDAVLAGLLARYSATLPPQVKLPNDGTLDIFVVIQGHSGSGKSKAGKCARALYPAENIRGVMMDRNVGSGEGLAEAFFDWIDEDGEVCSSSKKGATKIRTKHGLHFATDEGAALQASAGRMNSILIPAMCAAWMGESLGQLLADPSKSRMISPMTVRVSAEIRIQTAHGWKLFQEEFSSTGLSQRMVCVSAVDPKVWENFEAGEEKPEWPGELILKRPALIAGEMVLSYAPEIVSQLAKAEAAVHDPAWQGDPLDTHRQLSALKIAGIFCLWDSRTEISVEDLDLATILLSIHVANRDLLKSTQIEARKQARVTAVTHEVERELAIQKAREAEMLTKTVETLRAKIEAGVYPSKRTVSPSKREHYEDARAVLESEGAWPESQSVNPDGV